MFMGTSSNWSFGRRVLAMTYEQLHGKTMPPDNILFAEKLYDLEWDGNRRQSLHDNFDMSQLPSKDFAIHLLNAVTFHCGGLFFLFDEGSFLDRLALFHENPQEYSRRWPLWYVHYLLLLAFGKAFATQPINSQWPPGTNYFVQAMRIMPDLTFFDTEPIEVIQVLCCKALYLQSLNRRAAAHRAVSQMQAPTFLPYKPASWGVILSNFRASDFLNSSRSVKLFV